MRVQTKSLVACLITLFLCFLLTSSIKIELKLQQNDLKLASTQKVLVEANNKKTSHLETTSINDLSSLINLINFLLILLLGSIFLLLWLIKKTSTDPMDQLSNLARKIDTDQYDLSSQELESITQLSEQQGSIASLSKSLYSMWLKNSQLYNDHGLVQDEVTPLLSILGDHPQATFFLNTEGLIKYKNIRVKILMTQLGLDLTPEKTHLYHFIEDASTVLELIQDDTKLPFNMKVKIKEETIKVHAVAIYDSKNNYMGPLVTWELITKQVDQNSKLSRSSAIANASPICTMTADLDRNIDYINQASLDKFETLKDFLPVKVDEILGSSVDIFHSNAKHVNEIIANPENLPYDSQILVGGETLQLNLSALYDDFNNYSGVLLHWNIITKELEAQNKQLQKLLSEANQGSIAKSNFLANMTHELRTPLNGIIGFTDLLLEGELNDDQRESLGIVQDCASGLLELVNDLLDINRISAYQMVLEYKPIHIEEVIYACNQSIRSKAKDKDLELLISVAEIQGQVVFDSFRLKQVINNLLSNAVKFTQRGEILTSVSIENENETSIVLKFSVKDSGIGIAKENYTKILERFEQGDGSVTRKYNGVGLGLPLCKRILEVMGSELTFQSELKQGSTFSFVLNLQKHIGKDCIKESPVAKKKLLGKKVLIVERNPASLNINSELCRSIGCEVFEASDREKALEIVQSHSIDIALVELDFNSSDESSLYQSIRNLDQDVKGIALTSELTPEIIDGIQSKGYDSFLSKPLKRSTFSQCLLKVLSQNKVDSTFGTLSDEKIHTLDILVAEDNPIHQKMIHKILVKMGHNFTMVEDGKQAVKAASEGPYDIILMDIDMPVVDGIEAAAEIIKYGSDTPIIALIESGDASDKSACFASGMVDYITKPFVRKSIYKVLQKYSSERVDLSYTDVPKILVAEDNDSMLLTINNIIQDCLPLSIIKTANDGIEAAAILASFAPTILIVDLMMPNMNGQDLMRYMNGQEKYKDVQVIVVSALPESDQTVLDIKQMRDLQFISKPFKLDRLVEALKKCIS